MNYEQFALLYDELMNDVPYEKWVAFVELKRQEAGSTGTSLLDLACGTGNITLPLVQKGYDVTGVDLSEDMLSIAQQKLAQAGHTVPFYQQDMRELELPQQFDCITIFCDSLNYVTKEQGVKETFARVHQHLKQNGLLLFDVHSLYKIHHVFMNETYTINENDVALIWNCFPGEDSDSVEHDMTFFVQGEDEDVYYRFDEFHVQRTYSIENLQAWLEEAGFSIMSITGDFTEGVTEKTERIFFAAKKKP
ncbi:class I SAM-dependent DNA methyltransferase [Ectobacillus panaciterrae]|uniref:class I SAM-dependent DNA methyltransferase n=1 Tax=Ectobacillus panaciterrae TaxID=363872 RepID=UPI00041763AF|nr:class I SAM-dependent methyltransferase [Ectobacillus panaciterrae]